jgi:hypothetical protein
MPRLKPLRPEEISGLFGRRASLIQKLPSRALLPNTRVSLLALVGVLTVTAVAGFENSLISPSGVGSAVGLIVSPPARLGPVGVALLHDPPGVLLMLVALATPIFCAAQVRAIREFVPMNERNLGDLAGRLRTAEINTLVDRANRYLSMIGSRVASLAILLVSVLASVVVYNLMRTGGIYRNWDPTRGREPGWTKAAYAGWWANWEHHRILAIAICALATYLFFFLFKQLALGFVFAVFARSAAVLNFGVTPNPEVNTDGYWGLRPLRHFMQWTYFSTVAHFVATLAVFIVWLPFSQWTIFLVIAVMVTNFVVVFYPSLIAHTSAVSAKTHFIKNLSEGQSLTQNELDNLNKIWETPSLPFRARSTLTAFSIYLLAPLFLVLVSAIFKR